MNTIDTATDPVASNNTLLSDEQIASLLHLSQAWVRKERYLRNSGKPHLLTIDAIYIGKTPRYWASDINAWLEGLKH